jgi:hypothetical protein
MTDFSIAAWWWLIRYLGYMYPDEFMKAANDIGMLSHSEPMDQDQLLAMFWDANVGVRATPIIWKHFLAHFGTNPRARLGNLARMCPHQKSNSLIRINTIRMINGRP